VVYENSKAYLSINEELYALEDLDTIADSTYLAAYNKALDFVEKMEKLPVLNGVDMTDAETIDALEKEYNEMTEYEKSFLASDVTETLEKYVNKLKEIRTLVENSGSGNSEEGSSEENSGEENTE